jgi:hypothetical protein
MLKMVGSSGQLSLGKKFAGRYFDVEQQPDGVLLLRPMKVVPESEAWLHTPEMQERLATAEAWMKANPPRETDLDALISSMGEKA